ncbi:MAG TPA: asparagine synthase-related protein, partial [Steroidobacter sp.]|nr:asparagine synthase-related protein [Steroidobacter sp.]
MGMAIYGCFGRSDPGIVHEIGFRLTHRGEYERISTPTPGVHIGARGSRSSFAAHGAGSIPLVFSGSISNRCELAALMSETAENTEYADRRLLWNLYRQFGPAGFERVNGSYAIALVDVQSRTLVLAVDRWSAQPLHFAAVDGGWIFASEYKALVPLLGGHPSIDPCVAAYVAATKYLPPHDTPEPRIKALGPGEYMRLTAHAHQIASYQPLRLDVDADATQERCATELRERILDAARRLTQAHEVIGVGLSGGLDSAITLGAVRKVAPHKRIYTYTVSFHTHDPVLRKAAQTARCFGAVHREIIVSPNELLSMLPELVWRMEDPIAREEMLVYHAVAQHAARETPIVLYGQMADVLFAGMPRHVLIKAASEFGFMRGAITEFYQYTQKGAQPRSRLGKLLVRTYFRGRYGAPPRVLGAEEAKGDSKDFDWSAAEPLNAALL